MPMWPDVGEDFQGKKKKPSKISFAQKYFSLTLAEDWTNIHTTILKGLWNEWVFGGTMQCCQQLSPFKCLRNNSNISEEIRENFPKECFLLIINTLWDNNLTTLTCTETHSNQAILAHCTRTVLKRTQKCARLKRQTVIYSTSRFIIAFVCVCVGVCVCVWVCMSVCIMYVCIYVCMYVCMCVYVYVCVRACVYIYVHACMYVCMYFFLISTLFHSMFHYRMYVRFYVCMYVCVCIYMYVHACMYVSMYVCVHVCMYVCVCVCMYYVCM